MFTIGFSIVSQWCFSTVTWVSNFSKVEIRSTSNSSEGNRIHVEQTRVVVEAIDHQMLVFDREEKAQAFFFRGVQQKGRDLLKKSHKNMHFIFDRIFPPQSTTAEVFQETTLSLIDSLMDGHNCSVFAYGATGAGAKNFTAPDQLLVKQISR
ncbi:unnamed protein product [Acanthoscelides obtectus]|uniref:Kinesin motor domain-containing protein n=1 Tax=Acanthoscelides obtectus TaxID=200917 RepID=A0A9P0Q7C6_ACAOB|nr:unnamed protein product [Acanthoscelides obtectus]CAK1621409.1 Kinesin-like protein KIF18B [Acanthoscelides obtectus]